jgi:hypothetical protein
MSTSNTQYNTHRINAINEVQLANRTQFNLTHLKPEALPILKPEYTGKPKHIKRDNRKFI